MAGTNAQEGRVFAVGVTNTTAFLQPYVRGNATLAKYIEAAYPLGQDGLNTPYDQASQIFTELVFQCPQAKWSNATAEAGIPTWRYYFNASFINTQNPDVDANLGVYHSSEIPIVLSTYPVVNASIQKYSLGNAMRGAWARFAKNPMGGPGWNRVGTGTKVHGESDRTLLFREERMMQRSQSCVESSCWTRGRQSLFTRSADG